jgi:hypothetical protein
MSRGLVRAEVHTRHSSRHWGGGGNRYWSRRRSRHWGKGGNRCWSRRRCRHWGGGGTRYWSRRRCWHRSRCWRRHRRRSGSCNSKTQISDAWVPHASAARNSSSRSWRHKQTMLLYIRVKVLDNMTVQVSACREHACRSNCCPQNSWTVMVDLRNLRQK